MILFIKKIKCIKLLLFFFLCSLIGITIIKHSQHAASTRPAATGELQAFIEIERLIYPAVPPIQGEDIVLLQEFLKSRNLYQGPADGVYAGEIVKTVKKIQNENGRTADGFLDSETATILYEESLQTDSKASALPPPPKGELKIVIDVNKCTLTLYNNNQVYKVYRVAVGKKKTPSPIGEWKIADKSMNWGSGFGTRWLGLNVPWGIYGIHGTNQPWSIGRLASHGCFRMHNKQVEELFPWIPLGTPVHTVGTIPTTLKEKRFQKGMSGQEIVYLQIRLREMGFETGPADGRFGTIMEHAILSLQQQYGLEETGKVDSNELYVLGFLTEPKYLN